VDAKSIPGRSKPLPIKRRKVSMQASSFQNYGRELPAANEGRAASLEAREGEDLPLSFREADKLTRRNTGSSF
jgi:hypothetical protein